MDEKEPLPGEASAVADGQDYELVPCWASCDGACCAGGAAVTREELERIEAALPQIMPLLRPAAQRVVARQGFYCARVIHRPDFRPEEEPHWLRVVKGRCVFFGDFQGGHCALHAYCVAKGLEVAALKPLVCRLFPFSKPLNGVTSIRHWEGLPCVRAKGS